MALRTLSLFAGGGGLDLGLRIAVRDARTVCYVENDYQTAKILASRIKDGALDDAPVWSDVRTFHAFPWRGRLDCVLAGFPCPDYSCAGKRAGIVGRHGQLWDYVARIIRVVRPELVVLENVSGILVPHGTGDAEFRLPAGLWFVLGHLAQMGFDAEWGCVRAADVGASHLRLRWFAVAHSRRARRSENSRGTSGDEGADEGRAAKGNHEPQRADAALANGAGRGRGERRQPSGSGGLADGSHEHVANPAERLLPQPRRDEEGRNGAGPAGPDSLEHPSRDGEAGQVGEGGGSGRRRICVPGEQLADSEPAERRAVVLEPIDRGERREAATGSGRRDAGMADAECQRREEPDVAGQQAAGTQARARLDRGPERYGGILGHGKPERLEGFLSAGPAEESAFRGCGADIPDFPPGPGEREEWARILSVRPELAPAVSRFDWFLLHLRRQGLLPDGTKRTPAWVGQALRAYLGTPEAQSALRGVVDGTATVMDERIDSLRALGNGVVPLQAAVAITELLRRLRSKP